MTTSTHSVVGFLRKLLVRQPAADDGELLHRFVTTRNGDAFAQLLRRHGPMVLGVARRVLAPDGAEDVFQATFLLLARHARSVRRPESLGCWLHRTAFRLALRLRQQQARREDREPRPAPSPVRSPLDELTARELLTTLDEELERLPEALRQPLILCCLEGLPQDEAARRVGCSPDALRGRLERGRARLRQRLAIRGLTLPATLGASLLLAETVSAALVETTVRAAVTGAEISPAIRALIHGAPGLLGKLRTSAATVLLIGVVGFGVGLLWGNGRGTTADEPTPEAPKVAKTDLRGDALPDGAVARMGSVRFRHAGLSHFGYRDGGKTVVTVGADPVVRFWDVATGRQVRTVTLKGATATAGYRVFSDDTKRLAIRDGGTVRISEVDSGKELGTRSDTKKDFAYLLFAPSGSRLAVMSWNQHVTIWDWESGEERRLPVQLPQGNFPQGSDSTLHGHFSPDGKLFVAGMSSNVPLLVFDTETGREVHKLDCHARTSTVSPDGKRLAVCGWLNENGKMKSLLRLFDLGSGKESAAVALEDDEYYYSLAFSPDGKMLACGFSDRSCLRDAATGKVLHRLSGRPIQMNFTPDGKYLVGSTGSRLRFWDPATGKELYESAGEIGHVPVLAVSPDGRLLASGDWLAREVTLWDTATGKLLRQLPLKEDDARYVRTLSFSADGRTLYAGQYQGCLPSWDVASGKERGTARLKDPDHPNKGFVYFYQLFPSPDGKRSVTLERIGRPQESTRLAVWVTATGRLAFQETFPGVLRRAAWARDGSTIALPLAEGLTLLESDTLGVRFRAADTVADAPVCVSPDDRLLACLKDGSKSVGIWEAATGKEVATVTTGKAAHLALADTRFLVTADADSLRVWDLATGKERRRWALPLADPSGGSPVWAMALSPDGRRAFTALADGTALVWDLESARELAVPLAADAGEKGVAQWWDDLAAENAAKAYAAGWRLMEAEEQTVLTLMRRHLKPVAEPDAARTKALVADLDSDLFEVRQKAYKELEGLGARVVPALRKALQGNPSAEVRRRLEALVGRSPYPLRSPEIVRRLRAIGVLERFASEDARRLLADLAGGVGEAPETQAARAARDRLAAQPARP